MSQYVQNLNTIPSAHDVASQSQDGLVMDDALAMFTNSEFFDFVPAEMTTASQPVPEYDQAQEERTTGQNNAIYNNDGTPVDFLSGRWKASTSIAECFPVALRAPPGTCGALLLRSNESLSSFSDVVFSTRPDWLIRYRCRWLPVSRLLRLHRRRA